MAQATPDHAQLDQAQKDHGNHASYIKGFLWSALLTAVPFGLVMAGGFASPVATALVVWGSIFGPLSALIFRAFYGARTGRLVLPREPG